MDKKTSLPNGFISVEDAVELIKSDSRSDAKVDTAYLISHIKWIEENHNFRIPLMKHEDGKVVKTGSKYVAINRAYEAELLKETIRDHYRDMVGRDYNENQLRSISTVADEEKTGMAVNPRSDKPIAQEGATIGTGETTVTNGANL